MKRLLDRILPAPLLSAGLFIFWLVLNRSVSPGQLLIAAIVALALVKPDLGWIFTGLIPDQFLSPRRGSS